MRNIFRNILSQIFKPFLQDFGSGSFIYCLSNPCSPHLVPPAFQACKWLIFSQFLQNLVHGLWPFCVGVKRAVYRDSATMWRKHVGKTTQHGSYFRLNPSNLFPFHFKSQTGSQCWFCMWMNEWMDGRYDWVSVWNELANLSLKVTYSNIKHTVPNKLRIGKKTFQNIGAYHTAPGK